MSFMLLEPLIIIDYQWLQKHEAHWRFIDEAMPYGIDFIANIGHVGFFMLLLFFATYVHVRTVVGTSSDLFYLRVVCTI